MSIDSTGDLVSGLREAGLVEPGQLQELDRDGLDRFAGAGALGQELVRRGWLTAYQLAEVLQGRGRGLVLGTYVLLEPLGRGGMGEVYKALHRRLHRVVALKIIRPEYLALPDSVHRFQREARAAARLQHAHIVTVYDANQEGATHFLAMEYVAGTDLARLVKQSGPLPPGRACAYVRQAALGLQHAHEQGLVHRDVKPSNLVVAGGVVKVLDFGLARFAAAPADETALTPADQMVGTPDYIAPEQACNSRQADIRADVFSLGCTLFYLLTGRPAFPGSSYTEKLAARLSGQATPVRALRPDVPPPLEDVLARMMARDPADRYQTPAEAARALEPFAREDGPEPAVPAGGRNGTAASLAEGSTDSLPRETVDLGTAPTGPTPGAPPVPRQGRKRRGLVIGVLAGGLVLALLAVAWPGPREKPAPAPDAPRPKPDRNLLVNSIGMKFARIPAGRFRMGSPATEKGRGEDEGPPFEVRFDRPFRLGVYEVTQAEYEKVMGRNPSYFCATGPGKDRVAGRATGRLPVERVSWDDAVEFCRRLSARPAEKAAGRTYRLPTEAEWEYACRAGTTGPFHYGSTLSSLQANCNGRRPYDAPAGPVRDYTTPVGTFAPNAWGLYDMHGNVWEWCQDRWLPYAERRIPGPPSDDTGFGRVLRGGGWSFGAADCRSAKRIFHDANYRNEYNGFRVVCGP